MRSGNLKWVLIVVAAGVSLLAANGFDITAQAKGGFHRCKDVNVYGHDKSLKVSTERLAAKNVGCTEARRVARRWIVRFDAEAKAQRPYGYRCKISEAGTGCSKGARRIKWQYGGP